MNQNIIKRRGVKSAVAVVLTIALIVTSAFTLSLSSGKTDEAYAASSGVPTPYPWSKTSTATTGDYIADVYDGITKGQHVFEDVTVDRLADVLGSAGDYYVVFASPTQDTAQKSLSLINAQAKAAGITKIYHFNPILDNKYLDITSSDSTIQDLGGSGSVNYSTYANAPTGAGVLEHKIGKIQAYINYFIPEGVNGDLIRDYKSSGTLLFRIHKDSRYDVASEAAISESIYQLKPAGIASGYSKTAEAVKIAKVFKNGTTVVPASIRTNYDFFEHAFNTQASPGAIQTTRTTAGDAITDANYPSGAGFNVVALSYPAAFNLLNSPGEHTIYFAAFGCPNTQATIGWTAARAKAHNKTVYLIDGSLNGSVRWGFGAEADLYKTGTSNAWIGIRLGQRANATVPTAYAGVGHLYGALFSYFGSGIFTENSSRLASGTANTQQSVFYYKDGISTATGIATNRPAGTGASETGPFDAPRFQFPFIFSYNKDYEAPVTISSTAIQYGEATNGLPYLTEYMLSVANVNNLLNYGWKIGDPVPTVAEVTAAGINWTNQVQIKLHADGLFDYDKILDSDYLKEIRKVQAVDEGIDDDETGDDDDNGNGTIVTPTLNLDGGTNVTLPTIKVGEPIGTLPTSTKAGYTFAGWYVDGNKVGATWVVPSTPFTLVAKWTKNTENVQTGLKAFTTAPSPKIIGKVIVGNTLWADAGDWSDDPRISYRWYRDGKAISGARGAIYSVTKRDKGKVIQVAVTATKTGFQTTEKTSVATAATTARARFTGLSSKAITITGEAKVGKKLKAKVSGVSPTPTVKYQWYSNGVVITGATKSTLKLKKAYKGKKITVRITLTRDDYVKATIKSKAKKIKK